MVLHCLPQVEQLDPLQSEPVAEIPNLWNHHVYLLGKVSRIFTYKVSLRMETGHLAHQINSGHWATTPQRCSD